MMEKYSSFVEIEPDIKSQNVAKGWLSTSYCWEAAIYTLD